MINVVCRPSIIDAPWTPSPLVSLVSSLHHHPHQFPQWTSLRKFLWTSLLMMRRLHWVLVNYGTESGKVIIKVARRANTPPKMHEHQRQTAGWYEGPVTGCRLVVSFDLQQL